MSTVELDKLFETLIAESQIEEAGTISSIKSGTDAVELPKQLTEDVAEHTPSEHDIYDFLRNCNMAQRIKLALYGNRAARSVLVRDSNKQISALVLQNPRVSELEIHEFARNTNLDEGIFRAIANNSAWMRDYAIKLSLISNPRVPIDLSLRWIRYLQEKDLQRLAKSKGIPQVVARQCRRLAEKEKAGG